MDFFQHRYYKVNYMLMRMIGQWPFQSISTRAAYFICMLILTMSQFLPQMLAFIKHMDDWKFLMGVVLCFIYETIISMKVITTIFTTHKMRKLLNRIRTDWQEWAADREIAILHRYAEQGRIRILIYAAAGYSVNFIFMTYPIARKMFDIFMRNGTEPGQFPYPVDFHHLDVQKYYFYLITLTWACGMVAITVNIAVDAMFIVYVQHGCGLFAALGHKIERIGRNGSSATRKKIAYRSNKTVADFEQLVMCVKKHNNAIEFAELIEAIYSFRFFANVGLNTLAISITGFYVARGAHDLQGKIRYMLWLTAYMIQLFIENYMSQSLMDHSISIRYHIQNSEWYSLPLKLQRLLLLIGVRCNVPCKLTGGKMVTMSLETFGMVMESSLSYYTLLRTF